MSLIGIRKKGETSPPRKTFENFTELPLLGGPEGVRRLVNLFYDEIEKNETLRPMFPKSLAAAREKQALFFIQWFGGPAGYTQKHGEPHLRFRHRMFPIDQKARDEWMKCLMKAVGECVADPDLRAHLEQRAGELATFMINAGPGGPARG